MNYTVQLFTHSVDNAGNRTNDTQEFVFDNENLLKARRDAIAKAKELVKQCGANENFVIPAIAELRDYKNYSAFSVNIVFGSDIIFGEQDIDALESEASYYLNDTNYEVESFFEEDADVEVLEEDFEFLMS